MITYTLPHHRTPCSPIPPLAVEEEEGALGVWATYLLCGLGGCLASYLTAPNTAAMSLGASASVFGLFAVAVLLKFRLSARKLLEALVLGTFVYKQLANVRERGWEPSWAERLICKIF